jgi:hypothetical protein
VLLLTGLKTGLKRIIIRFFLLVMLVLWVVCCMFLWPTKVAISSIHNIRFNRLSSKCVVGVGRTKNGPQNCLLWCFQLTKMLFYLYVFLFLLFPAWVSKWFFHQSIEQEWCIEKGERENWEKKPRMPIIFQTIVFWWFDVCIRDEIGREEAWCHCVTC